LMEKEPEEVPEIIVEAPIVEPKAEPAPVEVIEPEPAPVIEELPVAVEPEPEPEEIVPTLPSLNESDVWVQENLPKLTWRKELLKLMINEDMIRRFVVFTDNFAQGSVAYEYSPFIKPDTKFSVKETKDASKTDIELWELDEQSSKRFTLYVELLRSIDTNTLVSWYVEMKPLVDQAYAELGYPDSDFTETLQAAITRVLDTEIPKAPIQLTRPSVMYKYADPEFEDLDDADKLLLRLGRENLLIIKSILLEINDKLSRQS